MLIEIVRDDPDGRLPRAARLALMEIADQIETLTRQIEKLEREVVTEARRDADMRRLATIPGVGAITAAATKAFVPAPAAFRSGRDFAAWLGLTPKPHSSGGKERLGRISKMGNPMLRSLLVVGATLRAAARTRQSQCFPMADWPAGSTSLQGRGGGAGQQDGADYLGASRQGRNLSESRGDESGERLIGATHRNFRALTMRMG